MPTWTSLPRVSLTRRGPPLSPWVTRTWIQACTKWYSLKGLKIVGIEKSFRETYGTGAVPWSSEPAQICLSEIVIDPPDNVDHSLLNIDVKLIRLALLKEKYLVCSLQSNNQASNYPHVLFALSFCVLDWQKSFSLFIENFRYFPHILLSPLSYWHYAACGSLPIHLFIHLFAYCKWPEAR